MVPELVSECAIRMQGIEDRWVPELGSWNTHFTACARWYLWKYMNAAQADRERFLQEDQESEYTDSRLLDLERRDEVQSILKGLSDRDQNVLRWRVVEGVSWYELGVRIGVSKNTAQKIFHQIMEQVRVRHTT